MAATIRMLTAMPTLSLLRRLALPFGLLLLAVQAPAHAAADVERLTDLVVRALPVGAMFDQLKEKDKSWPLLSKKDKFSAQQLSCMRDELSSAGYRRQKLAEVQAYVQANPGRVADDIALLESGAAEMGYKAVGAGFTGALNGTQPDAEKFMEGTTGKQMLSFISLVYEPKNLPLMQLVGYDPAVFRDGNSKEERQKASTAMGQAIVLKATLSAIDTCKIPLTSLF